MAKQAVNIEEIEPPTATVDFNYRTLSFREQFFPEATCAEWNNWRWQLRNRITDLHGLERIILLSEDERNALTQMTPHNPCAELSYRWHVSTWFQRGKPETP